MGRARASVTFFSSRRPRFQRRLLALYVGGNAEAATPSTNRSAA